MGPDPQQALPAGQYFGHAFHIGAELGRLARQHCLHAEVVAAALGHRNRGQLADGKRPGLAGHAGQHQLTGRAHRQAADVALIDFEHHPPGIQRRQFKQHLALLDR